MQKEAELEKLRAKAYDKMIDLAEERLNIPIRKNLAPNSKPAVINSSLKLTQLFWRELMMLLGVMSEQELICYFLLPQCIIVIAYLHLTHLPYRQIYFCLLPKDIPTWFP